MYSYSHLLHLNKIKNVQACDRLSPGKWKRLADYMAHSVSTAAQYYAGRQKTTYNVGARETVRGTLLYEVS